MKTTLLSTLLLLATLTSTACRRSSSDPVATAKALLARADACTDVECARAVRDELQQLGRDVLGSLQPLSGSDRDYVFRVAPAYLDWRVTKLLRGEDKAADAAAPTAATAPSAPTASTSAGGSGASGDSGDSHERLSRGDIYQTINDLCAVAIASDAVRRAHPGSAEKLLRTARGHARRVGVELADVPAHTGKLSDDVLAAFDYVNKAATAMKQAMKPQYPPHDIAVVEVSRLSCGLVLTTTAGVAPTDKEIAQLIDALKAARIHADAARAQLAAVFDHHPTLAQQHDAFIDFTGALGDAIEHEGATASAR